MKTPRFPVTIRRGAVSTKVYRFRRTDGRDVYTAAWHVAGARLTKQFPSYTEAHAEATLKADQLSAGRINAATTVTAEDGASLAEAKRLLDGVPLVSALQEWAKARRLCAGSILPAAEAWAAQHSKKVVRVTLQDAINEFIRVKDSAGNQATRTYKAKLGALVRKFGPDVYISDITEVQLTDYLEGFASHVTRNDYRKRAKALFNWAKSKKYLPQGVELEIDRTVRAKGKRSKIGIIDAQTYGKVLAFIRAKHPEHLAAVVLAGFCGIRSDEIHGKRADRSERQLWEHIDLKRKLVRVTVAKENTPADRLVPLCDAGLEWLLLCPDKTGPVCEPAAMEKARRLAIEAGFNLPKNCFRHSFISCRIAVLDGDKPQVATEAGNSVDEIDQSYRVPLAKETGEAWFAVRPGAVGEVIEMEVRHA